MDTPSSDASATKASTQGTGKNEKGNNAKANRQAAGKLGTAVKPVKQEQPEKLGKQAEKSGKKSKKERRAAKLAQRTALNASNNDSPSIITTATTPNNLDIMLQQNLNLQDHTSSPKVDSPLSSQSTSSQNQKPKTKAERRALQEAQRLAKLQADTSSAAKKGSPQAPIMTPAHLRFDDPKARAKTQKHQTLHRSSLSPYKTVSLFSHLPQWVKDGSLTMNMDPETRMKLHPDVVRVGLMFTEGRIVGGNARVLAMLGAFKNSACLFSFQYSIFINRNGKCHSLC